jgi:uncharacterized protein (DUF433 family)
MATEQTVQTSWIQKTPGVQGGDPCIRNTRITVHGLVEWRQLGRTDEQIIHSIVGLTQADLKEDWRYYEQHRDEIDEILRQEAEA